MLLRLSCLLCLALPLAAAPLRVCVEDDWPPMAFVWRDAPAGASVDIARHAFERAGLEVIFESGSYHRCLTLTRLGHYDAMLDVARNGERQPQFVWPRLPMLVLPLQIVASRPGRAERGDYSGLRGLRVGLTLGYEYPDAMLAQPGLIRVVSPSELANFRQLVAGRLDAMLLSAGSLRNLNDQLEGPEPPQLYNWGTVDELELFIAFHAGNGAAAGWARLLDESLRTLQQSGEDRRILQQWQAQP